MPEGDALAPSRHPDIILSRTYIPVAVRCSEKAGSGAMRVALDAMGGDFAPGPIVAGACEAAADLPELTVVLVGDQARIEAELAKAPNAPRERMPIVHASQVIGMEDKPVEALRKKRDNSHLALLGADGHRRGGRRGLRRQHRRHGRLGPVQRQDVPARRPPAGHRRHLSVAQGPDRHHRRRRQHERQGRGPVPVRHHGRHLRRGDPRRRRTRDRPA